MDEKTERVVRDGEPAIMEGEGYTGTFRKSDREERFALLKEKLKYDTALFCSKDDPDALVDLIEVAHALGILMGYPEEEIARIRRVLKNERGSYSRGTVYSPEVE